MCTAVFMELHMIWVRIIQIGNVPFYICSNLSEYMLLKCWTCFNKQTYEKTGFWYELYPIVCIHNLSNLIIYLLNENGRQPMTTNGFPALFITQKFEERKNDVLRIGLAQIFHLSCKHQSLEIFVAQLLLSLVSKTMQKWGRVGATTFDCHYKIWRQFSLFTVMKIATIVLL